MVSFRSCRAIHGGFLLLAMRCSYLVNDTWSLPSLSRSTQRKTSTQQSQRHIKNALELQEWYFIALIYGIYNRIYRIYLNRIYLIIYLFGSKTLLIFTNPSSLAGERLFRRRLDKTLLVSH